MILSKWLKQIISNCKIQVFCCLSAGMNVCLEDVFQKNTTLPLCAKIMKSSYSNAVMQE